MPLNIVILILPCVSVVPTTLTPERLGSIKQGIAEAHSGKTRPASEVLSELGL